MSMKKRVRDMRTKVKGASVRDGDESKDPNSVKGVAQVCMKEMNLRNDVRQRE